jgi:toxin ParE1/3/4
MDYRIEWSPEATEDIEAIAEFISRDSDFTRERWCPKIFSVSRTLADFPHIGRAVPELGDANIRERFVYSYRLVYRIEQEKILVVAVVHGKRLLEPISNRFTDTN